MWDRRRQPYRLGPQKRQPIAARGRQRARHTAPLLRLACADGRYQEGEERQQGEERGQGQGQQAQRWQAPAAASGEACRRCYVVGLLLCNAASRHVAGATKHYRHIFGNSGWGARGANRIAQDRFLPVIPIEKGGGSLGVGPERRAAQIRCGRDRWLAIVPSGRRRAASSTRRESSGACLHCLVSIGNS